MRRLVLGDIKRNLKTHTKIVTSLLVRAVHRQVAIHLQIAKAVVVAAVAVAIAVIVLIQLAAPNHLQTPRPIVIQVVIQIHQLLTVLFLPMRNCSSQRRR